MLFEDAVKLLERQRHVEAVYVEEGREMICNGCPALLDTTCYAIVKGRFVVFSRGDGGVVAHIGYGCGTGTGSGGR